MANLELTAQNQGYYKVYVEGESGSRSNHSTEREAIEKSIDILLNEENTTVFYKHDYEVQVTLDGVQIENTDVVDNTEPTSSEPTPDPTPEPSASDFIQTSGSILTGGGDSQFYFNGTNAYYLPNYQKIDESVVDRAFDAFSEGGVKVIRTWGFYDGAPQYENDITIQPEARVYNEDGLVALDKVIAKGKELNMRFILPFINYWSELGGIEKYVEWGTGTAELNMNTFINNDECQSIFKDYIDMLLNRVNTITGVAYKDEPAIMMWEIGNEIRNPNGGAEELRDWYQSIAQYIKSIDSNHLVATGEEGFDDSSMGYWNNDGSYGSDYYTAGDYSNTYPIRANQGTSYVLNTQIPEIDVATFHWYPSVFGFGTTVDDDMILAQKAWLEDHYNIAVDANKPTFVGEYGIPAWGDSRATTLYTDFYNKVESIGIAGDLLWQLAADYVKCYEYGGNICYPAGRADDELFGIFKQHSVNMNSK